MSKPLPQLVPPSYLPNYDHTVADGKGGHYYLMSLRPHDYLGMERVRFKFHDDKCRQDWMLFLSWVSLIGNFHRYDQR